VSVAFEKIEEVMSDKLQCSFTLPEDVKPIISKLLYNFRTKWQQVQRKEERFFDTYDEWLSVFVSFNIKSQRVLETSKKPDFGRPSLEFATSSDRTKKEDLCSQTSVEELSFATQMSLRAFRKLDAAKVVKDVTLGSPSKAKKYRKSLEFIPESILFGDSALSLVIEHKLSKS